MLTFAIYIFMEFLSFLMKYLLFTIEQLNTFKFQLQIGEQEWTQGVNPLDGAPFYILPNFSNDNFMKLKKILSLGSRTRYIFTCHREKNVGC